jgi:hypothetical protein
VLASALTVAALPAVWLVNRDDDASTRPNVAALGAALGDAPASTTPTTIDPMGDAGPQFLDGTASGSLGAPPAVAAVIGSREGQLVGTATALFRRAVRDPATCLYSGVPGGSRVIVVNVANDRSVECWTTPRPIGEPQDEVVMSAAGYAAIADPTTAPIHVEIRLR